MVSFGEYKYYNQTQKWKHFCGGAVISSFCIASAAHCFFGPDDYLRHAKIRVGDQNFTDTSDNFWSKTYEIRNIIKHSNYSRGGVQNDLALVFTETEIEFNVKTNYIDLPNATIPIVDVDTNQTAKFSGWGWFNGSKVASDALRASNYTVFTGEYCKELFNHSSVRNHLENTTMVYCAGRDVSIWKSLN
mgnify:FL=1